MNTQHSEEKEAIESALARTAIYRGVALCVPSVTRVGSWTTDDDGNVTGPNYTVTCAPSAAVKALIDASLSAPVDPPAPPAPPPPVDEELGAMFTVLVDGATVHITDLTTGAAKEQWSWGNGGTSVVMGDQSVTYRYAKTYTITLIAWDAGGKTSKHHVDVTTTEDRGPAAPPISDGAPAPAPPQPPATTGEVPMPSVYPDKPAVGTVGAGSHAVVAKVIDLGTGEVWKATANVGADRKETCQMVSLANADGAAHPALMLQAYADKCHVHVARMDNPYDYLGYSLEVTYDGQPADVPPPTNEDGSYDFWKGCWHPSIDYGEQEPFNPANVDRSMFPNYGAASQPQVDTSKFHFSWNGMGGTNMPKMGATGERGEIGPLQQAYMTFWLQPTAANWELVKKIERYSCQWANVFICEPSTGAIIKYTDYPAATILPPAQSAAYAASNPVAAYGGWWKAGVLTLPASLWENGSCPYSPNTAHLTSYGTLAAMITRTAHDQDLLAFWANYCFIDSGPTYIRSQGFVICAQRRTAWALRSVFVASYYGSQRDYFNSEMDRNLELAKSWPKNKFGFFDTHMGYPGKGGADGYVGYAQWMQSYLAIEVAVVALKRPEWLDTAREICKLYAVAHSYPFAMCLGVYGLIIRDVKGVLIEDFRKVIQLSLENNGFTEENALACVNSSTVEECYAAVIANSKLGGHAAWGGKCINGIADYIGYLNSPSSYPSTIRAAVESAASIDTPGIEQALQIVRNQPTPIDYSANQKYHIVTAVLPA